MSKVNTQENIKTVDSPNGDSDPDNKFDNAGCFNLLAESFYVVTSLCAPILVLFLATSEHDKVGFFFDFFDGDWGFVLLMVFSVLAFLFYCGLIFLIVLVFRFIFWLFAKMFSLVW